MEQKAYIVLENGRIFEGRRFGADGDTLGELVVSTAAVGYLEALTDPCYFGQILVQTFPLIGNYGTIGEDCCGNAVPLGYICYEHCEVPSNFRSEGTLDAYLKEHGIPGICGVDTRALTRVLRDEGTMNAAIVSSPDSVDFAALKAYRVQHAVAAVMPKNTETTVAVGAAQKNVALWHCGQARDAIAELTARGCSVTAFPANTDAQAILAAHPDGLVISDGPGDPAEMDTLVDELRTLLGKLPIFAFGLGHQLLALATGGKTEKMHYGHRGANQPAKNVESGRVYISTQNHGYIVTEHNGTPWFVNANDNTCEGLLYSELRAASVQFAPETCAQLLYDRFAALL